MKIIEKIGFVAPQKSGKDYLLNQVLNAKSNVEVHVIRMADPIKEMCNAVIYQVQADKLAEFDLQNKEKTFYIDEMDFQNRLKTELEKINQIANCSVSIEQAMQIFTPFIRHHRVSITPRKFQQLVGTDLFRKQVDMDFWVKFAEQKMVSITQQSTAEHIQFICPDVRFDNEASLMDHLIYIHRPNNPHQQVWHESEEFCKAISDRLNELGTIQQAVENQYFPIGLQFSPRFDTVRGHVTTVCINNG